jgi:hypothetical protein
MKARIEFSEKSLLPRSPAKDKDIFPGFFKNNTTYIDASNAFPLDF